MEGTTGGDAGDGRSAALDRSQTLLAARLGGRQRLQQRRRVGMPRRLHLRAHIGLFDDATQLHDGYFLSGLRDYTQVVRDQQDRSLQISLKRFQQL